MTFILVTIFHRYIWRKCSRFQQKLPKTTAKSLTLTAFLVKIGFFSAIWELTELLMPTSDRVLHMQLLFLSPLITQLCFKVVPREKQHCRHCQRSLASGQWYTRSLCQDSPRRVKSGFRGARRNGCTQVVRVKPEVEMGFVPPLYQKTPCNVVMWDRQF